LPKSLISQYTFDNSESKIRSRANHIRIKAFGLGSDNQRATYVVYGSGRKMYTVQVNKFNSKDISTTCTCPYDWGGLCKHAVAALRHLDGEVDHVAAPQKKKHETKKKERYSRTDPYRIKGVKAITTELIHEHMQIQVHPLYQNLGMKVLEFDDKSIRLEVMNDLGNYYTDKYENVVVQHDGHDLHLKCSCGTTNEQICQHQAWALYHILSNFSPYYFDKEYKRKIWEEGLASYGYTLEDDYKELFDLRYEGNQLKIVPLVEGMMPLNQGWFGLAQTLDLQTEGNTQPWFIQTGQKKKIIYGYAIGVTSETFATGVFLLEGKANKDGAISTNIKVIRTYEEVKGDRKNEVFLDLYKHTRELFDDLPDFPEFFDGKGIANYLKRAQPQLEHFTHLVNNHSDDIPFFEMPYTFYQVSKRSMIPITIHQDSCDLAFVFSEEEKFFKLKAFLVLDGKKIQLDDDQITDCSYYVVYNETYYLYPSANFHLDFRYFIGHPIQRILKHKKEAFLEDVIFSLMKKYPVEFKISSIEVQSKKLNSAQLTKKIYLSELEDHILFRPMVCKGKVETELFGSDAFSEHKGETIVRYQIDESFLDDFKSTVRGLHPEFEDQIQYGACYISFKEFTQKQWFLTAFEKLKSNKVEIFGLDNFKTMNYNTNRPEINAVVKSEVDWFEVNMDIRFGDASISLSDVKKAVLKQQSYVKLDDGSMGFLPEEWLKKMERHFRFGEIDDDNLRISKHHFSIVDEWFDELDDEEIKAEIEEKKRKLLNFDKIKELKKPTKVLADLRDYQLHGFNWLGFLDEFNWGGCLADDMGLGKTLQVIALLRHKKDKKIKIPSLVVVPTSLIFNWQKEIDKFCPSLKIHVIAGVSRKKNTKDFDKVDVILISYGLILKDVDYLKDYMFNYVILDESQAIKNPGSKRYKAVRLLQAKNRIVMTGTPVENSTLDLYSQMSFVNPGLLGNLTFFKDYFVKPIEKHKDEQRAQELNRLIKPFMIRRTKEQVATELPEKTEMTLYCEMEKAQQKVYDAYRNKYRNYLLGKIEENGLQNAKIYVLEGLLKLRQICNSPALLSDEEDYGDESVKIQELMRHITEKTGQHKILIFSQFVKMLHLIEVGIKKENIQYEYLDGSTKDRQKRVDNFEENDDIRVFLISLKAGGTGLNLTSADYVYIVDPWWNPAVESQAIDRCYRIGQEKHVMAYKMICKNTVEEKIVALQDRKKKLVTQIVTTDDNMLKSLTKTDIEVLFS